MPSQPIGASIQLPIGQLKPVIIDRHRVRTPRRLRLKKLMNPPIARKRRHRPIPLHGNPLPILSDRYLHLSRYRFFGDRRGGLQYLFVYFEDLHSRPSRRRFEDRAIKIKPAPDGAGIKQIRIVSADDAEAVGSRVAVEAEIELRGGRRIGLEAMPKPGELKLAEAWVEVESNRNQRDAPGPPRDDEFLQQPAKRHALVLERLDDQRLRRGQEIGERLLPGERGAHRQHVHAVPNEMFATRQILAR